MIKKVNVKELRPGMFVSSLNVPWIHHPFLRNSVKIKNEKIIRKIINTGTWEVYIDTDKSQFVDLEEYSKPLEKKVLKEIADKAAETEDTQLVYPLKEEIKEAENIRKKANIVVEDIMTNIRDGKSLTISQIDDVVDNVVTSVTRNQHALLSLSRFRKKNQFIFEHSVSTCALMISFSKLFKVSDEKQHEIGIGALLHDIGMSNISTKILNKPGKLSQSEISEIKKHVEYGMDILDQTNNVSKVTRLMTQEHHERYNGSGYPNNLHGENISNIGQMMAIVDVYDAMTSNRGYRAALNPSNALIELLAKSDEEFKGDVVHKFIQSVGIYPFGTILRLVNGLAGIVIDVKRKSLLLPVLRIIIDNKNNRISPYDIDLKDYETDDNYRITGVEFKHKLFLSQEEINNILKLDIDNS